MTESKAFIAFVACVLVLAGAAILWGWAADEAVSQGRNTACASVCDDYGWWGDTEERCICAKELGLEQRVVTSSTTPDQKGDSP